MKIKSLAFAAAAASTMGVAGITGLSAVSAQTQDGETLSSRIATAFNLDQSEVESTIDGYKDDKRADKEAERLSMIDEKVTDGTITEDQKSELVAILDSISASREEIRDSELSREGMKALREESRTELQAWAETNDVELKDILGSKSGRGHHGQR